MTGVVVVLAVLVAALTVALCVCRRRLVELRQVAGAALVGEQTALVAARCSAVREHNALRGWSQTLDTWRRLRMSGDDRFLTHFEGLWQAETPVGRAGTSDGR